MPIEIAALSARFHVNAERGEHGVFPRFSARMRGKKVLLVSDETTAPFASSLLTFLRDEGVSCTLFSLPEREPVADEKSVALVQNAGMGYDYLLAVGSGTLNDLAKFAAKNTGKECGVFATAPSMDGFTSGVAALIEGGAKVTRPSAVVSDVLLDFGVLASSPRLMRGAGAGDILAKYCCLTDWKISHLLTGEAYNAEAADLMYGAVRACDGTLPALAEGRSEGAERLMEALLVSGYAMVIAGSSRPASGAEHHISHFLEMDFLRRGEKIPLHGIKVGLGTLVSLYLYHTLSRRPAFRGCEKVYAAAEGLPSVGRIRESLSSLGCPVRFSEIGVSEETFRAALVSAHKLRDRFTILSLCNGEGIMTDALQDELCGEFL